MPCENSWSENGLYRKFTGNIQTGHILKSNFDLHRDDRFQSLRYVLNDFREINTVLLDEENVEDIAVVDALRSSKNKGLKVALVIANTSAQVTLALAFAERMKGSHYQCKVFMTSRDAHAWVNTP